MIVLPEAEEEVLYPHLVLLPWMVVVVEVLYGLLSILQPNHCLEMLLEKPTYSCIGDQDYSLSDLLHRLQRHPDLEYLCRLDADLTSCFESSVNRLVP